MDKDSRLLKRFEGGINTDRSKQKRCDVITREVTLPRETHASRISRTLTLGDVVHGTSPSLSTSRAEVESRTHACRH